VSSGRAHLATLVADFERHGSDIAIVASRGLRRHTTTYAQLAHLSRRFAAALIEKQIGKGDRVLLWGPNCAEWVAAFFGCVLRGVLPVPLDSASPLDFVRRVEREVSPRLITGDREKLQTFSSETPRLVFEEFDTSLPLQGAGELEGLAPDDTLQIVFTSGTTAEPKGIVHTHKNVLASLAPIESEVHSYLKYERFFHPIRILHTLPLSHVFGQFMGLWVPPLFAAEVHYEARLVAPELIERIRSQRISVLAAVPRILDLLESEIQRRFPTLATRIAASAGQRALMRWWRFRDVHRHFGLKFWAFVCGGAALPPGTEEFWGRLGFVVVQGYGMTETTALVSLNHPFRTASGTIGQVLPGREVRLSEEGEVLVRGDTISNTVWQHGKLQRQDSPWLATGDLAALDTQGNLRFRGRKKDVIVTAAGLNIYPEDVEAALSSQSEVKAAAVVESAGASGPEPLAVLVLAPGADARSVVDTANRGLADFQQIRRWFLWPEPDLPRTSTGKVLKREISARLSSSTIPAALSINGLDSLGRVELQAKIEQQYGVTLDEEAWQKVDSAADLERLLAQTRTQTPREAASPHRYPRWPRSRFMQALRVVFLESIALPLLRLLAKPRLDVHATNWPSGPVLLVSNHVTSYDAPFVLYALPPHLRRRVAIAMSAEMLLDMRRGRNQGNWFLNLLAPAAYLLITGLFHVFPLPQFSGFRRSFEHAGEALDQGYSVLVFPEGHRSDDGSPQPFKSGAGLLWKELGCPAVPVRLDGLGQIKAQKKRWFRSGEISIFVGEPLPPAPWESPEVLTERLRRGVFPSSAN
jgi:long-chain acyl-CoA synthetase